MVLATSRLNTSPATIPRTPPQCCETPNSKSFHNLLRSGGGEELSNLEQQSHITDSRIGRKCSIIMPEGPAAAPRRAHFTFFTNRSLSNSNANSGWWLRSASGNGTCGVVDAALATAPMCVAFQVPEELLPAHGVQKPHPGVDVGSTSSLESFSTSRCFGMLPPRGGLNNSMRGNNKKSFQPRHWILVPTLCTLHRLKQSHLQR